MTVMLMMTTTTGCTGRQGCLVRTGLTSKGKASCQMAWWLRQGKGRGTVDDDDGDKSEGLGPGSGLMVGQVRYPVQTGLA